MRTALFATLGGLVLAISACGGSGAKFADKPRPAAPANLTVYINDARVSLSPDSVGAGLVVFVVTNQANKAESLTVHAAGDTSKTLASTGPINPQATAQVTVDFTRPGEYTLATSSGGKTDAAAAVHSSIQAASLHIGTKRPDSNNALLQP